MFSISFGTPGFISTCWYAWLCVTFTWSRHFPWKQFSQRINVCYWYHLPYHWYMRWPEVTNSVHSWNCNTYHLYRYHKCYGCAISIKKAQLGPIPHFYACIQKCISWWKCDKQPSLRHHLPFAICAITDIHALSIFIVSFIFALSLIFWPNKKQCLTGAVLAALPELTLLQISGKICDSVKL